MMSPVVLSLQVVYPFAKAAAPGPASRTQRKDSKRAESNLEDCEVTTRLAFD